LLRSVAAKRQVARARSHHVDTVEMERLRGRVANLEPAVLERDRLRAELDQLKAERQVQPTPASVTVAPSPAAEEVPTAGVVPAAPDLTQAAVVLGHRIALDDLKVIPGVGPKVEQLCHGIGIRTWYDLSTTEVSLLRTMLVDAGSRFRALDPSAWPGLAGLLAEGRWQEYKAAVDARHD
jgi:predicted flap endonuclease-1-like 5' DNA nuclease